MRRMQLIEIHDQPWFPGFLRDLVTENLQLILNLKNLYQPIVPRLRRALRNARTRRILDLCSGAGGPWLWLYKVLEQEERSPIEICLTDKYPNVEAFDHARIVSQGKLRFRTDPVDATQIPAELDGFRTIFASFHHFRPHEARTILRDAVDRQQGIGIFEVPGRHALTIALVFLIPVADLLLTPFLRPFRLSRIIWTYLIPLIPFVLWFDGIVSCLRIYSPPELAELMEDLPTDAPTAEYCWEIGEEKEGFFSVPITYLIGYPNPQKDT